MNKQSLVHEIKERQSFLCVGLDPDLEKIPTHLLSEPDPIFAFNKAIIDATKDYCVAYKPNLAFYEAEGIEGWKSFVKTIEYIPKNKFIIADAKRGDIGNTSNRYAKAFFEKMPCDAITIAPYMGEDSVTPFLGFKDKWAILLGLTSNKGSADFQRIQSADDTSLYVSVIEKATKWGSSDELMFVIGATHPEDFEGIRALAPDYFFLVPGVGAQGGNLEAICKYGINDQIGLLVNSSRGIIYAGGKGEDFTTGVREAAKALQRQMQPIVVEVLEA